MKNLKAKYFTADTPEAAQAEACRFFDCDISRLAVETISEFGAEPVKIIAVLDAPGGIANMNAFFSLYFEQDGVYLEIYAARGSGAGLDNNELIEYLRRKKIAGLNLPAVQKLVEEGSGRVRVANAQQEYIYGEDLTITISGDERDAIIRLLEPEPGGPALTVEEAMKMLGDAGVTHGIDEEGLARWLTTKLYNEPFTAARATPPIDGDDGKLIFHFSTEERTGKPREIDSTGRVDFRSLDLYVPVTENELLVSKVPATEGQPGITVKGNPIKQRPGKEAQIPRGKNISYNEERTEARAVCSGMVEFINNSLNVSNVYTVQGDCDISVGNIDFDGSVQISGSVRSGNIVKATNGITVGGNVEAASLKAGGNIEVKGGMLGVDKGLIEAGGSVTIMFVERGKVLADGPIKVDVAIHSTLETADTIQAIGKRGAIIGGSASAAGDIVANYLGALSNTKTQIRVGFMPRKRARLEELEKNAAKLKTDKVKLEQLDAYLAKTKGTLDEATWNKLFLSGEENKRINEETLALESAEIEKLHYEMEHATENRVHVLETAYGGTRINIGNSALNINNDIGFATFRFNDGEIVYGPCEKSKTDYK